MTSDISIHQRGEFSAIDTDWTILTAAINIDENQDPTLQKVDSAKNLGNSNSFWSTIACCEDGILLL
jgi:hypothetical protein